MLKDRQRFRILAEAYHILATGDSIRDTAAIHHVSYGTTWRDITLLLADVDKSLHKEVQDILARNRLLLSDYGPREERAILMANYIFTHDASIRATAQYFHIGRQTVHNDLRFLASLHPPLYDQVRRIFERHTGRLHVWPANSQSHNA